MKVARILDPEGDLLNLIEEIGPLEWRKYQQRNPEVWVRDHFERESRSEFPPFISFRFQCEDIKIIEKLKVVVDGYKGKVKWVVDEHKRDGLVGINWTIKPGRMLEVKALALKYGLASSQYMAKYEPGFGPIAYDDLVGLTEHVRDAFFMKA